MTYLGKRQELLLREALRRWSRFYKNEHRSLTEAWTGLGTATEYAPAVKGGYMELVDKPTPGYQTWWKLTAKGAAIVQEGLDLGITHETIEKGS